MLGVGFAIRKERTGMQQWLVVGMFLYLKSSISRARVNVFSDLQSLNRPKSVWSLTNQFFSSS